MVAGDQFIQARLVDRNDAFLELFDLARVDIHADDVVAEFGKTGTTNKTDIPGPNHR